MSIVKQKDPRSGRTYVYESESYWDKEKKQPRARRRLIGRLDEETGEIVPTDGRGRRRKEKALAAGGAEAKQPGEAEKLRQELEGKERRIRELEAENNELRRGQACAASQLMALAKQLGGEG